jgi:hypothetical protein
VRVAGAVVLVASVVWCLVGLAYDLFFGDSAAMMVSAILAASLGIMVGAVLVIIGQRAAVERRWRSDLRRGTATIYDLRPGEVSSDEATQELFCRLEIRAAGMATTRAEHLASVGPLDALRLVEGATFACQVSPALPDRVRVWLGSSPYASDLTGRYLDFGPVQRDPGPDQRR